MEDTETEFLGMPRMSRRPQETPVKGAGKCDSLGGAEIAGKHLAPEKVQKEIGLSFSQPDCKGAGDVFV